MTKAGHTILLVDDDDGVRRAIDRALRRLGYRVVEAVNGQEALQRYEQLQPKPDLVLLDLDMPVLPGDEALVLLLEADPTAVVLIVTGHADQERAQRLLAAGAAGCLHKPVDLNELSATVKALLVGDAARQP